MNETLEQIQNLANERQHLWRKAAQVGLSDKQVLRVQTITTELNGLWDMYRRELASEQRPLIQSEQDAA